MDYLKQSVAAYYNVTDTEPKRVALEYLLNLDSKYLKARNKRALPCFQPQAIGYGRAKSALVNTTGLIQLDYDLKDNPELASATYRAKVIDELIDSEHILAAQTSAGGSGVYALLVGAYLKLDTWVEQANKALTFAIDRYGLVPDERVTRNVASLRFISPAQDLKINEGAVPYNL